MSKFTTRNLTLAAIIAAVYAALTLVLPSFSPVQIRLSEALTVLPFLFPAAGPGVILGCLIANLLSPYGIIDIVCGTLATSLAVFLTMRSPNKWLAPLPPVLCNGVVIGAMIAWYEVGFGPNFLALFALHGSTVALGQLAACYGLGLPLLNVLPKVAPLRAQMGEKALASQ